MSCGGKTEEISSYLDGELSPEEKEELEKHLLFCEVCQKEIKDLRKAKEAVKNLKLPKMEEEESKILLKRIEEKTIREKRKKWLLQAALIPIAAALLIFFLVYPSFFPTQKPASLETPKTFESKEARPKISPEKKREGIEGEALKSEEAIFLKSLKEAQKEVGYPLKAPQFTMGGKIIEIMVSLNKPLAERNVSIYYDNGLVLSLTPKIKPLNYAKEIERLQSRKKESKVKEPFLVQIKGKTGIAGYYYSPEFGNYPGYVIWYEEGIEYFLNYHGSPQKSFSFKELLKVASSVKEIKKR